MLHSAGGALGTPDVHFTGHVSNEELAAYYDVADLFLCASEHEGFCVPLIEAFHMRVPVVARAATAVPATLDGGGVLYEDRRPVSCRVDGRRGAVGSGLRRQRARGAGRRAGPLGKDFGGTLLGFVEIARSPRRADHESRSTSGTSCAYERLEELRMFRPAIYKGFAE